MIIWANPLWFWAFLIIPIIIGLNVYRTLAKKNPYVQFSDSASFEDLPYTWRSFAIYLIPLLQISALSLLILALARPQLQNTVVERNAEGIDIMMVLDLSTSMRAEDLKPNRFDAAKRVATQFVDKRTSDRIGIVVFAAQSFTVCPPSLDYELIKKLLLDVKMGVVEDGTAIGMGLATSVNRLKDSRAKSKVIILLTDGVNNSGFIDPKIATELAVEFGIKTYTIGLGSNGTARAPVGILPNGSFQYAMTKVEIDEALLQEIATATGGIYFRATDNKKLEEIYEEINKLEKTEVEEFKYYNYEEKYRILILLALILIVLEWIGKNTIFKSFI